MSNDAPIHECESEINHYTGHYVPYSLRRVCWFFNVPQIFLLHVQGLVRRGLRFIVLIREDCTHWLNDQYQYRTVTWTCYFQSLHWVPFLLPPFILSASQCLLFSTRVPVSNCSCYAKGVNCSDIVPSVTSIVGSRPSQKVREKNLVKER